MKPVVSRSKELFKRRILNFRFGDSVIAFAMPLGIRQGMILRVRKVKYKMGNLVNKLPML